jgi:preprotein translocase subunit SecB
MSEEKQAPSAEDAERQFMLRTIYLKDLSFESPNAPAVFRDEWKPDVGLQLDIKVQQLAEDTHEVVLTLTVTAKLEDKTAYLIEVQQAGIVSVKGFAGQELGALFYVYCPGILFPYARQAVTDLVGKGGFPQLVLQHINFDAIYAHKLSEQQADGAGAEKAH